MENEKLPRYAVELIEQLDVAIPRPRLPFTEQGWMNLTSNEVTRLAFRAGQRALVDDLVTLMEEDDGNRDSSDGGPDGSVDVGEHVRSVTERQAAEEDEPSDC